MARNRRRSVKIGDRVGDGVIHPVAGQTDWGFVITDYSSRFDGDLYIHLPTGTAFDRDDVLENAAPTRVGCERDFGFFDDADELGWVTVDVIAKLKPCYSDDQLRHAMRYGFERGIYEVPEGDARWVIARLLTHENRFAWAKACAERARGYADASGSETAKRYVAYANAAHDAAHAVAHAAAAAAAAAAYAVYAVYADAADADAEHRRAVGHALELLAAQGAP